MSLTNCVSALDLSEGLDQSMTKAIHGIYCTCCSKTIFYDIVHTAKVNDQALFDMKAGRTQGSCSRQRWNQNWAEPSSSPKPCCYLLSSKLTL